MTSNDVVQIVALLVAVTIFTPLLGAYLYRVIERKPIPGVSRVLGPVERGAYRLLRIDPDREQGWKGYAGAVIAFSAASFAVLYAILRLQGHLPLNPGDYPGMSWSVAFNTAISFVTNTNWQFYAGESTLSYLSQMAGLAVQNFASAAVGIAVMAAVVRGFARRGTDMLGNFWTDLVRITLYALVPLAVVVGIVLGSQGVMQTFGDPVTYPTYEAHTLGTTGAGGAPVTQSLYRGPVASQIAIKQAGTNGGGYYNSNSATPAENPTPVSNEVELWAELVIAFALTYTFGLMVGSRRQGWAIFAAMMAILVVSIAVMVPFENRGSEVLQSSGVELQAGNGSAGGFQPGGNMSDKEVRFGPGPTALWAAATTGTSTGAVNGGHDALTGGAGTVTLALMTIGEVAPGGVGSGIYGMLLFVVVAVFISGLMVGRTPEYLGKKIGAREIKLTMIGVLVMPIGLLVMLAVVVTTGAGTASIFNSGPQGFAEAFYAYASQWNNNGSAFAGYGVTDLSATLGGVAMGLGRFVSMLAVLGLAGALVRRPVAPFSAGTLRTTTPTFVVMLIFVIALVAALNFIPALALGPVATELSGRPF
ncbi:MAG TPA: potassium-transporting ATPase subunit KdpA [Miltoncostaea sp.]|nr:potassium-transporting ATPase subunit KdpA [Miltoncostaea sp.]